MVMVREISGKLYSIRKVSGKQQSQPISEAIAEQRQALDNARARLAVATASYETLRDQLRVAVAGGNWTKARALQGGVDQAKQQEREADAAIARLTDQLAEFEQAVVTQRVNRRERQFHDDLQAMLGRYPIPTPPEAA